MEGIADEPLDLTDSSELRTSYNVTTNRRGSSIALTLRGVLWDGNSDVALWEVWSVVIHVLQVDGNAHGRLELPVRRCHPHMPHSTPMGRVAVQGLFGWYWSKMVHVKG